MVKPITPLQARSERVFPGFVLEAVNNFLKKGKYTFSQNQIISAIIELAPDKTTKQDIFDNGWLDFETVYRDAGWVVVYDKPGYNESYEATFNFTPKAGY